MNDVIYQIREVSANGKSHGDWFEVSYDYFLKIRAESAGRYANTRALRRMGEHETDQHIEQRAVGEQAVSVI